MLFNSLEFAVFLPVVLALYYVLPNSADRARRTVLLVASYLFYASWNPPFVALLLGSTVLDYNVGKRIEATDSRARRRALLALSLCGNLGVLGFFKYGDFFLEQYYALLSIVASPPPEIPLWNIILPVGISFYTFQTLSYSIDVYRGVQRACRSLLDFALFVSFFPQLVAGPIVRSTTFLPQLESERRVTPSEVEMALVRIAFGLFKKVVLADSLGAYVDDFYTFPQYASTGTVLLAMYAYAFQIYFDFSGYSDIAIGVAALFGFKIPENFNRPYLSANPREFWQRWHISLSTWLRDYLYISLGGNRRGNKRTYFNLAVTMLLGGLWHGAAWNFIIWGALHGLWLALHRLLTRRQSETHDAKWIRACKQLATFHIVCIVWVFFRAPDLATALQVLERLLHWGITGDYKGADIAIVGVILAAAMHLISDPMPLRDWFRRMPAVLQGFAHALILALVYLCSAGSARFIYFQF